MNGRCRACGITRHQVPPATEGDDLPSSIWQQLMCGLVPKRSGPPGIAGCRPGPAAWHDGAVARPNSDDWLRKGFRSGERRCVVETIVYYRIWTDENGARVGVTVDYEYAEDVHFELDFASWSAFLQATGLDADSEVPPQDLREVLFQDGYAVFQNTLIRLRLPYSKRAFS